MKAMDRFVSVCIVLALTISLSAVAVAKETCSWDVTGTYDASQRIFSGDGEVTLAYPNGQWWRSDVYACYMVREDGGAHAAYAHYFPRCDQDGDGRVTMADVWEIYNNQGLCPCTPVECGPAPMAPMYLCPDYSWGGNIGLCERNADSICGWVFRECPRECELSECGPAPMGPVYICPDGTPGGNIGVCVENEDGVCGWVFRDCPE